MASSEFPRQFVRATDRLSDWSRIQPYFEDLLARPIEKLEQLNAWLVDWSELAACIDEVGTDRYVKMTCQTSDPEYEKAYLTFVEQIEPKCKPMWHRLETRYVASPAVDALPRARFEVFNRSVRNRVELYREENVALEVEEAKLEQKHHKISGAMTVEYEGKEQTLQQLARYLEGTDRCIRRQTWELGTKRRLQDAEALEDIFDELLGLRHRMARNAGLADYRAYAFRAKERFDYTPEDCITFHEAIEKACVPLVRDFQEKRQAALGLEELRPWDLSVDVKGRPPLAPFETIGELIDKCAAVFERVDPELGEQFRQMAGRDDLDLESRKGKAPGGYQSTYHESRRPFIFMNAVGIQRDVRTLIHEGGHAFHALACRHDPLLHYRNAPIEFAEVASMGMEMLAYEHFDVFYSGSDLVRAKRQQLEGIVAIFPWVATIDAFQHWMYTHPEHTRAERRDRWLALHDRFGGIEQYNGYEEGLARSWQKQLHLFQVPFYYVEYAIAQLGALQIWLNANDDRGQAVRDYRRALPLGGSRPLPELFQAANTRFDFSIDTLGPLMDATQRELQALED